MENRKSKIFDIFEMFRNLRSDAVPKAPRPTPEDNITISDVTEEDVMENENFYMKNNGDSKNSGADDIKKEKQKQSKSKNNKKFNDDGPVASNTGNVQATGSVVNIVGSIGVKIGTTYVFHAIPKQDISNSKQTKITMDHLIHDVMDSKEKLMHEYGDCIAKNMSKNWQNTFRALGYNQGKIETSYLNWIHYDLAEVRYQLLLDWVRNDEEGTLGKIATVLWNEGEREVVKLLSVIYKNNKTKNKYPIANPGPSRAAR